MTTRIILAMSALCFCTSALSAKPSQPDRATVGAALKKYLARHGDLCLGKFDWPIDVTERDFALGTRDAVQMPVLEKLGLVIPSNGSVTRKKDDTEETVAVQRYALTEAGKKFYLNRELVRTTPRGEKKIVRRGDFCAARLSLHKLVRWDKPTADGEMTVTYTYNIAAAPWTQDPEARRVFPMVDRILNGAGTLQLHQRFRSTKQGWEAISPSE